MKRAAINNIAGAAILILFLVAVLFAFFGKGLLPKIAEAAEKWADESLGIGTSQKKPTEDIDPQLSATFAALSAALKPTGNGPCITTYPSLASDFKEHTITLSPLQGDTFMVLRNDKSQVLKTTTIPKTMPCVVTGDQANTFYSNYIQGKCTENCPKDYAPADLEFRDGKYIYINGVRNNFEGPNTAYETREGNVCLFTRGTTFNPGKCDAFTGGLPPQCFEDMKQGKANIKFCGATDAEQKS